MSTDTDVQLLNPGGLVTLYTLDATEIGGDIARFHQHHEAQIVWQGNTFVAFPVEAEGFGRTSDQQPTPRLRVGNVKGQITALCQEFDDLVGAVVLRQRVFVKYLDAVNFPGGNPSANLLEEFPVERWIIERKSAENPRFVEFELASALDFNGVKLPRRQIVANQCTFQYRQEGCAYIGPPVATAMDLPTSDPLLDKCGRRLSSCKLREWPDAVLNFGGQPAAGLVRT